MFSVDNFYDCFYANYGLEKTENLILVFQPHGSKDLHNLEDFGNDSHTIFDYENKRKVYGRIVMHDQEPLSLDYLDTYRQDLRNQKKIVVNNPRQELKASQLAKFPLDVPAILFFKKVVGGGKRAIICHSELNSDDIKKLEEHGFISCYYWWHGLIARDWFRHWQYYTDLQSPDLSLKKYRFLLYSRDHTGTRKYRKQLVEHCRQYQNLISYAWDENHVDSSYSAKIDINDAISSSIHIIAETLFDSGKIYLTEKVFKPMVMSQPFILFGPPGSLKYLKNYGFKTFDDFWDESYDNEINSNRRMTMLLELIDHLADMPDLEFGKLYQRMLPVIKHNRERFYSQDFQDDLILEMRNNINRALFEQDQSHQHSLDDKSSTDGHNV